MRKRSNPDPQLLSEPRAVGAGQGAPGEWAFEGRANGTPSSQTGTPPVIRGARADCPAEASGRMLYANPGGTAEVSAFVPERHWDRGFFHTLIPSLTLNKGVYVMKKTPHKVILTEDQMPRQWFNMRSAMKEQPDPMLRPDTLQPVTEADLAPIFCEELARQELDATHAYTDIPEPVLDIYKMYRPSPLIRAYDLEKALGTPARIYFKYEGNNTSGSHKLNSAVPQAYYAKQQGLSGVTTETGAGQWGTALSVACAYFDLSCDVYMVTCT